MFTAEKYEPKFEKYMTLSFLVKLMLPKNFKPLGFNVVCY